MIRMGTTSRVLVAAFSTGLLAVGAVCLYWKLQAPIELQPVPGRPSVALAPNQSVVIPVPVDQYTYLGPFSFFTTTVDSNGFDVGSTRRITYSKNSQYRMVTPSGLGPGDFSVVLSVDYQLNPLYRAQSDVEFMNLHVQPQEDENDNR